MTTIGWKLIVVVAGALLVPQHGGQGRGSRQDGAAVTQDKAGPQKKAGQQGKAGPQGKAARQGQSGEQRPGGVKPGDHSSRNESQAERKRALAHIGAVFPRTASLLGYLEKNDPAALQSVLAHSADMARRREAAAIRMAREHHPELAQLLQRLRRQNAGAYQAAVRDLVADAARIQQAQTRSDADYQAALNEWKLRSQVRLVAAQMKVNGGAGLERNLEDLLRQSDAANRRQIELNIERYKQLIQRLEGRLAQDPEKTVQAQLRRIVRQARPAPKKTRNERGGNDKQKKQPDKRRQSK